MRCSLRRRQEQYALDKYADQVSSTSLRAYMQGLLYRQVRVRERVLQQKHSRVLGMMMESK